MRRILLVLSVALMMAVMMVATAMPAFAKADHREISRSIFDIRTGELLFDLDCKGVTSSSGNTNDKCTTFTPATGTDKTHEHTK